ncbi:ubiquinone anaerobic biosynthesis protein UbiU [Oryzibacter oryziterrae]|uniref:ubiquinone anaerobic biosynthesis protein UbiU n=1 Tax=Oryzibacter oryziterrae TaxID=2766474 RepID=UPI001F29799B|nr:peptidase U32 family protein [Oryzibacter oryziterrae]
MSIELVCPAGTPSALRAAVDAGAHSVYCGFRDETNARNFPGLNFSPEELTEGVRYAHARGAKVLVAINTFAKAGAFDPWKKALENAEKSGADAVILADLAVLDHAARNHPALRLHLSVQAAAATPEAIEFYQQTFGVKRIVLPRVLSVEEIATLNAAVSVETEAFVFGGLCPMTEGRCSLSSYVTGRSPNLSGVCSPPEHVAYEEGPGGTATKLAGYTIDRVAKGAPAGYPTLCKGSFVAEGKTSHLFEDPVSLNASTLIAALARAGVTALKIEGRQRGKGYVAEVVRTFRAAVEAIEAGRDEVEVERMLAGLVEGGRQTSGAYKKTWR